jgi:hypothetical protein
MNCDPSTHYHGKPCVRGHGTLRYKSSRRCVICTNELNKYRYATIPQQKRQRQDHVRALKYGCTPEQYDALFEKQEGKCACCDRDNSPHALCVDHNHRTGAIRGLLCHRCNGALGALEHELAPAWHAYLHGRG